MTNNENEKKSSLQQMLDSVRSMMKTGGKEDSKLESNAEKNQEILELTDAEFIENPEISKNPQSNNDVLAQLDSILKQAEPTNIAQNSEENTSPNTEQPAESNLEEKTESESDSKNNIEENTVVNETIIASNSVENSPSLEEKIVEDVKDALISETTSNATISAIRALKKKIERPLTDGLSFRSGITMEDLVIEAIKPYLSEWLDKNLPNVVKHLVEKELKKLIPNDD